MRFNFSSNFVPHLHFQHPEAFGQLRDALLHLADQLDLGIGKVPVGQQFVIRELAAFHPGDPARNADDGAVVGDRLDNHGPRADPNVVADSDRSQDDRAHAEGHPVADGRMALPALLLPRSAQRDALVDQDVVADLRRSADDHARSVVDEEPLADAGAGVDLDPRQKPRNLGEEPRHEAEPLLPDPVGKAVEKDRVETWIAGDDLQDAPRRRVPLQENLYFASQPPEHGEILSQERISDSPLQEPDHLPALFTPTPPSPSRGGGNILASFVSSPLRGEDQGGGPRFTHSSIDKRIMRLLVPDRRALPVAGNDDRVVVQGEEPFADRAENLFGVAAPAVRPADPLVEERVAREEDFPEDGDRQAHASGRVAGRMDDFRFMPAERDPAPVGEEPVDLRRTGRRKAE